MVQLHEWLRAELAARGIGEGRFGEALGWSAGQTSKKLGGSLAINGEEALAVLRYLGAATLPEPLAGGPQDAREMLARLDVAARAMDGVDLAHVTALAERLAERRGSGSR